DVPALPDQGLLRPHLAAVPRPLLVVLGLDRPARARLRRAGGAGPRPRSDRAEAPALVRRHADRRPGLGADLRAAAGPPEAVRDRSLLLVPDPRALVRAAHVRTLPRLRALRRG